MNIRFRHLSVVAFILMPLFLMSCGPTVGQNTNTGLGLLPEGSEKVYSTSTTYSGSTIQIQAQANYQRFYDYSNNGAASGLGTQGNPYKQGLVNTETKPIRRAEVVILNSSGTVIQAGHTDNSGAINLIIPNTAGTYTVQVNSRADNSYLKASIMNNPYDKGLYSVTQTVTVSSGLADNSVVTPAAGALVAPYNGTTTGAAFNILEDVLLANEYLRTHVNVNNTSSSADYCPSAVCNINFTVAPKVSIYWTKGLSPGTYYNSPSTAISFFVSSAGGGLYEGLYILGGIEGSVCTDTDHFDNSVILHEYGHFLEKAYAISDSPGGSHSGNKIIDPRLAWSEGWANFFQAAVLGRPIYRDTLGNSECTASYSSSIPGYYTARLSFSDFNIETQTSGQDIPSKIGEGNFREMSISRSLWDTITGATQASPYDSANDSDGVMGDLGFAVLWKSFANLSSSTIVARNIGHLHQYLYSFLDTASFGSSYINAWTDDNYSNSTKPLVKEKQRRDLRDFGLPLTVQSVTHGSCVANSSLAGYTGPDWTFTNADPKKDTTNSSNQIDYSDPFNNNDFYRYDYDGTAAKAKILLHYKKKTAGAGPATPWDLDLYVYSKDFVLLNSSDIVRSSSATYPETSLSGYSSANGYTGYEVVDLSGLAAGTYFINVKVYYVGAVSAKGDTDYYLELQNGNQLCP